MLQASEQDSKPRSSRVQAHGDQRAGTVGVADRLRSTEGRFDQPPVFSQASIATHSFELEGFGVQKRHRACHWPEGCFDLSDKEIRDRLRTQGAGKGPGKGGNY